MNKQAKIDAAYAAYSLGAKPEWSLAQHTSENDIYIFGVREKPLATVTVRELKIREVISQNELCDVRILIDGTSVGRATSLSSAQHMVEEHFGYK